MTISIFANRLWHVHTTTAKIYKRTLKLCLKSSELPNSHADTPTVSMMSNNDRCSVYGQTGHFGHHCPNVQCYSCNEFGCCAQDCLNKIPLPGTPYHQNRSTLKIPPRHNGVIPITIKDHNSKVPIGYFIYNQHINRRLDQNIPVIDGIITSKADQLYRYL